jgi:uncharacterized protein (DUF111 family)
LRISYLDTFSGISGDMTVGALLDLGLPIERVRDAVSTLGLDGVEVWAERTQRCGMGGDEVRGPRTAVIPTRRTRLTTTTTVIGPTRRSAI